MATEDVLTPTNVSSDETPGEAITDALTDTTSRTVNQPEVVVNEKIPDNQSAQAAQLVTIKVNYKSKLYDVSVPSDSVVSSVKSELLIQTQIPVEMQKLVYKGQSLKDDVILSDLKLTKISKLMLVGSNPDEVKTSVVIDTSKAGATPLPKASGDKAKESLGEQQAHRKILDKGPPEDTMSAIRGEKHPLPLFPLTGMLNKVGGKVRLTFKLDTDELWIATKEKTEKVPMRLINDVTSEPIKGFEEYCIVGLQMGPTEKSRYWVYWVPSQYVNAIKDTILGTSSMFY